MRPPATPVRSDSLPGRLHVALRAMRRSRDAGDLRALTHHVERLTDAELRHALALAVVSEAWTDEERANAVTFPPEDDDTDPRTTRAFRRFLADDRRHNKEAAA